MVDKKYLWALFIANILMGMEPAHNRLPGRRVAADDIAKLRPLESLSSLRLSHIVAVKEEEHWYYALVVAILDCNSRVKVSFDSHSSEGSLVVDRNRLALCKKQ